MQSILQEQTGDTPSLRGLHTGLEAAVRAQRSGQSLLPLPAQSLPPRNPHRGLCSGRGACSDVCALQMQSANPAAPDTARLFRRGEATLGSCGVDLAPTPRMGRREIPTLARGSWRTGRGALPSTALKAGAKVMTWPALGHLPLCLVYQARGWD